MQSVILFAHGSRDPLWRAPVEAVAQAVAQAAQDAHVRCAYLELCEPDLPSAAAELVRDGARHIRVLPLFLGVGRHARHDLPLLLQNLQTEHPGVQFELLPTVGENPRVIALLAELALGESA